MKIPIKVTETGGIVRIQEPVEIGFPLSQGKASPETQWVVLDEHDNVLPSQFKPLVNYEDGSLRATHGIFLLDLKPGQTRSLTVTQGKAFQGKTLLHEEKGTFHVTSNDMKTVFNSTGELTSLSLSGTEVLDLTAGPSFKLVLALGPAWHNRAKSVASSLESYPLVAKIKETGPIRAILNVSGKIVFQDRRGKMELLLDCDYTFYANRSEIHIRPMLLGAITDATILNEWSLVLHIRNGKKLTYGRSTPLIRDDPHDENMSWRGLEEGWICWDLPDQARLIAWSPDFGRHQNGFVHSYVRDQERKSLKVVFSRVEPHWCYPDVGQPPKAITINRGSWRRWEAVFAVHKPGSQPQDFVASWQAPLRAFPTAEYYRQSVSPWLEGISRPTKLRQKVIDKCEDFVCKEPEYVGSLYGGRDGPNNIYIERGVSRGDFGEYLFNEFFRTGESRFYRMGFDFGQIYRDIFCFTIEQATEGTKELGSSRSRHSEHVANPVRSYRGAVLLAYMHQETGDERYLDAMRKRAGYHLTNYPHSIGRQSMSTRDSAFMAKYLNMPALMDKAVEVTLHSLNKHFDPVHGFFEGYDHSRELPDGRFPPDPIPEGQWGFHDFFIHSNASPEMTAYNIIGWYGFCQIHNPGPEVRTKIQKVCEWFRDHQNKDGSWSYPHHDSKTRWGHGSLQDAMAMLFACKMFRDPSFLESAKRSIAFTENCFEKFSYIPLVLGSTPHEETEDSLTYYYGIETLAHYNEIMEKNGNYSGCFGLTVHGSTVEKI